MPDEPSLDEIYRLTKENNQMLRAMRRDAFVKGIFGIIWWILILVVIPYVSWLFIQPYLKSLTDSYGQAQNTSKSVGSQFSDLQNLLKQYTGQ